LATIIPLLVPTDTDNDSPNAERNKLLFEWAHTVLKDIGAVAALLEAQTIEELRALVLDLDTAEVTLAIRDALHPASGNREKHFDGLREGGLKRILKNQFADLKAYREKELRHSGEQQHDDWMDGLIRQKNGTVATVLANLILILREAPAWKGVLGFDEFKQQVVITQRPPWGEEPECVPWTDHHESLTRVWFQSTPRLNPSLGDVGRAVQAAARSNAFHPVVAYFDALAWDGVPRLDVWLATYFHTDDTAYVRAIGPRYLISAVARIFRPGCQVDHTLVLEGPQGKMKSEALRTLAINDAWFTDRLSHLASKDAAQELSGVLIVEIAELDALTKASSSTMKSFLTRRRDRFRAPYGKHVSTLQRQCVFAGTINPPVGGYLRDPTGARRLWPIVCRGTIDRDAIERDRDQLWAEAVHRFKAGERWWLETAKLEALATAEQAARFVVDPWEEQIREWLGDDKHDVAIEEVLGRALGFKSGQWTQANMNRTAKILTHLGFKLVKARRPDGGRQKRYRCDPENVRRRDRDHRDQAKKTGDQTATPTP
jgi:predicted P-loop ATPase